jgi:hypothetical protein
MTAGMVAAGSSFSSSTSILIGGAFFGSCYVLLSGVYLVWGLKVLPERPATGLVVGFLMVAVGQMVGAPVFGVILNRFGVDEAVSAFALLEMTAGIASTGRCSVPHKCVAGCETRHAKAANGRRRCAGLPVR